VTTGPLARPAMSDTELPRAIAGDADGSRLRSPFPGAHAGDAGADRLVPQ